MTCILRALQFSHLKSEIIILVNSKINSAINWEFLFQLICYEIKEKQLP